MAVDRQISELTQILLKRQTTFNAEIGSLTTTDLFEVEPGAKGEFNPTVTDLDLIGSGFPQGAPVIGPVEGGVSCTIPMRTGNSEGAFGNLGNVLPCLGFKETKSDTGGPATQDQAVYSFSNKISEWYAATLWLHTGNIAADKAILNILYNVLFTGKISLDFDKATAKLALTGKGVYKAAPAAGSQAATSPIGVLSPAVMAVSGFTLVDSTAFNPITVDIDIGGDIVVMLLATATYGKGQTQLRNRKIKWSAKVYAELPASVDPHTMLLAGTSGAFSCIWGASANEITLSSTKQIITKVTPSDQNGVETYDVEGYFIDNDFSVTLNTR